MQQDNFSLDMDGLIAEYKKGNRTSRRAMEIVSFLMAEAEADSYDDQLQQIKEVVIAWDKELIDDKNAIEKICAIHRLWSGISYVKDATDE